MSASTETARPDAELGSVVDGRYRLLERVGIGGMGAVYKAEHVGMGRVVAVKLLRPELGGRAEAVERFTREAQASARVAHKNVCAVSDFGVRDDGTLYLVMEFLRGETLRQRLDRVGRLPWPSAVTIARHVARGLAHAHAQGVVHRDIKPENIFLVDDDDDPDFAKIVDFGIARSLENDDGRVTQAGFVVGTPAYLSPEQALGGEVDHRCDIYSLCTVLFEMITGRTPFGDRPPVAMLTAHAVVDVPAFSEVAPDLGPLPPVIEMIVRRGLAKDREERQPDAGALTAALDEVRGRPSTEHPVARPSTGMPIAHAATPFPGSAYTTPMPGARLIAAPPAGGYGTPLPAPAGAVSLPTGPQQPEGILAWFLSLAPWLRDRNVVMRRLKWVGGGALVIGLLVAIITSQAPDSKKAAGPAAPPSITEIPQIITGPSSEERLKAALHDLTSGKTCADRKAAVARLADLGDPAAIPALKKARYRMRGGMFGVGDSNTNACLKADAEAAIDKLTPGGP